MTPAETPATITIPAPRPDSAPGVPLPLAELERRLEAHLLIARMVNA